MVTATVGPRLVLQTALYASSGPNAVTTPHPAHLVSRDKGLERVSATGGSERGLNTPVAPQAAQPVRPHPVLAVLALGPAQAPPHHPAVTARHLPAGIGGHATGITAGEATTTTGATLARQSHVSSDMPSRQLSS